MVQRLQQFYDNAAEADEDGQCDDRNHCEDYDAGEAERQRACFFGLAGGESIEVGRGGKSIVGLIGTTLGDARSPVGQGEVVGRVTVQKRPVSRPAPHQERASRLRNGDDLRAIITPAYRNHCQ